MGLDLPAQEAIQIARRVLAAEGYQSVAVGPTAATFVRDVRPPLGLALLSALARSQEQCTVTAQTSRRGTALSLSGVVSTETLQDLEAELLRSSGHEPVTPAGDNGFNPFPILGASPPRPVPPATPDQPVGPSLDSDAAPQREAPPRREPALQRDAASRREPALQREAASRREPVLKREAASRREPVLQRETASRREPAPYRDPEPRRDAEPRRDPEPYRDPPPLLGDPGPLLGQDSAPFVEAPDPVLDHDPLPLFPQSSSPLPPPPPQAQSWPPEADQPSSPLPPAPMRSSAVADLLKRPRRLPEPEVESDLTMVQSSPLAAEPVPWEPSAPRWVVILDDGRTIDIPDFALIGRDPTPAEDDPEAGLVSLIDPEMSVSKTHASFGVDDEGLWFLDRYSTNGTSMQPPGGERVGLEPGVATPIPPGSEVWIGRRHLRIDRADS
ncbi:MAG TPA: hypothetical protein VLL08_17535 [Kineosporiaceae bacterium]|nr:hypothetical protein [Kineosporiaceae bacterium]